MKDDTWLCVCDTWHRGWKESMPCQGFSQMLSGFLHHFQQYLLSDIQTMCTMHGQGPTGPGSSLKIILPHWYKPGEREWLARNQLSKELYFFVWRKKNQIIWALDRISKVMGKRKPLSLSIGLTVLFRVVKSEEARLSEEQWRTQSPSLELERQAELLRLPFPYCSSSFLFFLKQQVLKRRG